MTTKQHINLDEIYSLLDSSMFEIKGRYVLSFVERGFKRGFKIIDLIEQSVFWIPGSFGVHNLNSIYTESYERSRDALRIGRTYDIESGAIISSFPTTNAVECGAASDGFYLVGRSKIQLVDLHANSTDVYTRSDNDFVSTIRNDSMVVFVLNETTESVIFIKNHNVISCELHVHAGQLAYTTAQDVITIFAPNSTTYTLYDVSTRTTIEADFADFPISTELSIQGLMYTTKDGLYLNQEKLLHHRPGYVQWLLLQAMCSGGFEDIKLLASLTPRQLLTLYVDQLIE